VLCCYRKTWPSIPRHLSNQWYGAESCFTERTFRQRFAFIGSVRPWNLTAISADMESVNLDSEEWISDVNNVTSVLKMWFRELPDPLLTSTLHQGFVEAASKPLMLCRYGNFLQGFQKSRTIACGTYVYTSESMTYRTRTTQHSNIFWGTCTSVFTLVVIYLHLSMNWPRAAGSRSTRQIIPCLSRILPSFSDRLSLVR